MINIYLTFFLNNYNMLLSTLYMKMCQFSYKTISKYLFDINVRNRFLTPKKGEGGKEVYF